MDTEGRCWALVDEEDDDDEEEDLMDLMPASIRQFSGQSPSRHSVDELLEAQALIRKNAGAALANLRTKSLLASTRRKVTRAKLPTFSVTGTKGVVRRRLGQRNSFVGRKPLTKLDINLPDWDSEQLVEEEQRKPTFISSSNAEDDGKLPSRRESDAFVPFNMQPSPENSVIAEYLRAQQEFMQSPDIEVERRGSPVTPPSPGHLSKLTLQENAAPPPAEHLCDAREEDSVSMAEVSYQPEVLLPEATKSGVCEDSYQPSSVQVANEARKESEESMQSLDNREQDSQMTPPPGHLSKPAVPEVAVHAWEDSVSLAEVSDQPFPEARNAGVCEASTVQEHLSRLAIPGEDSVSLAEVSDQPESRLPEATKSGVRAEVQDQPSTTTNSPEVLDQPFTGQGHISKQAAVRSPGPAEIPCDAPEDSVSLAEVSDQPEAPGVCEDSYQPSTVQMAKGAKKKSKRAKGRSREAEMSPGLQGGTKWVDGVRRSTRFKSRPLETWRGEKFLFARIHSTMVTLVGVKHSSPPPAWPKRGQYKSNFKVESLVPEEYAGEVEFAAYGGEMVPMKQVLET